MDRCHMSHENESAHHVHELTIHFVDVELSHEQLL